MGEPLSRKAGKKEAEGCAQFAGKGAGTSVWQTVDRRDGVGPAADGRNRSGSNARPPDCENHRRILGPDHRRRRQLQHVPVPGARRGSGISRAHRDVGCLPVVSGEIQCTAAQAGEAIYNRKKDRGGNRLSKESRRTRGRRSTLAVFLSSRYAETWG